MTRAAYHRAYYWSHLDARREAARLRRRRARWVRGVVRVLCEAVEEARNDKAPTEGALTRAGGEPYAYVRVQRDGRLVGG